MSFGRVVLAVVFVAAMVGAVAAGAVASGDSPWDGPSAMSLPDERMFDDPVFQAAMARALARDQAEEGLRGSAAAVAAREASRSAFDELDGAAALALAQREFPALMAGEGDELQLSAGDRVVGFPSRFAATVLDADGDRSVVVSSEPLATREDGPLEAVDLDLDSAGPGYEPERGAVEVVIPRAADEWVRVGGEDVGVRPADAAAATGVLAADRVFYPEVAVDTDYVATPTRAGAQVMWQLRSPQAPERLGLDVDVPDGGSMRMTGGDVEIVDAGGVVVGMITAPVAVAADGVSVPAVFRFVDGELVVEVGHRGRDVAYPVLVDPEVRDVWGAVEFGANCGGGPSNFAPGRWTYQQWVNGFSSWCGNADGWGNGLFVISDPVWYSDTARGHWIWSPPAGAYIMSVWFDGLRHQAAGTHLYTGLYGQSWGSVDNTAGGLAYGQITQYPNSPYNAWAAVVGLWMNGSYTRPHQGIAAVRGINIRLGDLDPPIVQLGAITGGLDAQGRSRWFNDATSPAQVTINAIDGGLGLKTVEVVRDGTGTRVAGIDHVCAGHRSSPCPRSLNPTLPLGLLPEGLNAIQTRARDIVDNQHSGPHWTQRIDRSAPEITLSGELIDHATDGQLGANPSIPVHARDGSTASAATHRSGVKRVRLLLDGVVREDYTAPETSCDNCDRGLSWTLPLADLLESHTVKVEAWDYVGNSTSRTVSIEGSPIDAGDIEGSDGDEEPASADDRRDDPAGEGASASAPSTCRNTTNVWGYTVGGVRAGFAKLTARFCRNPTARTTWTRDSWISLDNDTYSGFEVLGFSIQEEPDKIYYNVTHRSEPRGGIHIEMTYKIRHCALVVPVGCTHSPTYHLVTYGYYHGGVYRTGYRDE